MKQIGARALADWLADSSRPPPLLVDVREPWEIELCAIAGARCIPMGDLEAAFATLDPEQEIVVICHHGIRSTQVAHFLEHSGYARVYNLHGGIEAWAGEVDPAMPRY